MAARNRPFGICRISVQWLRSKSKRTKGCNQSQQAIVRRGDVAEGLGGAAPVAREAGPVRRGARARAHLAPLSERAEASVEVGRRKCETRAGRGVTF